MKYIKFIWYSDLKPDSKICVEVFMKGSIVSYLMWCIIVRCLLMVDVTTVKFTLSGSAIAGIDSFVLPKA